MTDAAHYLALCGGVGGAKLADGLAQLLPMGALTVAVNVGDDFSHLGLTICPDLDTVVYALSDRENPMTGWGRRNESWCAMDELAAMGGDTWFKLGDKDIALHLLRLQGLAAGASLSEVTAQLCARMNIRHAVSPVTDQPVRTHVQTNEGELPFQQYFVRRRCEPVVTGFTFRGAEQAQLASPVLDALNAPNLAGVIICPSNPYVSIGPMLAIAQLRTHLSNRRCPCVAVSPIVGGDALKGPAAKMMRELGFPVNSVTVARYYGGLADEILIDHRDAADISCRNPGDPGLALANTVMSTRRDRVSLARICIDRLQALAGSSAQKD